MCYRLGSVGNGNGLGWIVTGTVSAEQVQQVPCHQILVHHVEVDTEKYRKYFGIWCPKQ